jgi:hypothetical protein
MNFIAFSMQVEEQLVKLMGDAGDRREAIRARGWSRRRGGSSSRESLGRPRPVEIDQRLGIGGPRPIAAVRQDAVDQRMQLAHAALEFSDQGLAFIAQARWRDPRRASRPGGLMPRKGALRSWVTA